MSFLSQNLIIARNGGARFETQKTEPLSFTWANDQLRSGWLAAARDPSVHRSGGKEREREQINRGRKGAGWLAVFVRAAESERTEAPDIAMEDRDKAIGAVAANTYACGRAKRQR